MGSLKGGSSEKNSFPYKKADTTFEDTFIDARGAKKLKLLAKPALIKAGIKDLF